MNHFLPILLPCLLAASLPAQNPARSGTDHAVFFYVTTFQPDWPALPETKAEVEAIGNVLKHDYGFTVEYVRNPTKADIENKILELNQRKYGNKDQLLLFFSMHGHFIASTDRGYLIPADGRTPLQDPLGKSWLSYDDLGAYLSQNPCKHILLSLDACYSGAFGIRQNATERTKTYPGAVKADAAQACKSIETEALFAESYLYFTAGGNERAPAQSKFAEAWLRALGEGWQKKVITTNELRYAFGSVRSPAPEGGLFSRKTNGGDFVFMHKTACATAPPIDKAADKAAWNTAKAANTLDAYRQYIADFPNGEFRPLAEDKIKAFEKTQKEEFAWEDAKRLDSREAYDAFIRDYPDSEYRELAEFNRSKKNALKSVDNTGGKAADLPGFVFVQGGEFKMPHSVTLSDFYLARQEVTVKEYLDFANATNANYPEWKEKGSSYNIETGSDDHYKKLGNALTNERHPVVSVSWYNAVAYCNWRSEQDGFTKVYTISGSTVTANWNANGYRLPTEAEWEFAARSRGKDYKYAWGNGSPKGNIGDETAKKTFSSWTIWDGYTDGYLYTAPVDQFEQGDLGLFNMSGNAWEWCWDWKADYPASSQTNPRGPDTGSYRVVRGGSWGNGPALLRCAYRGSGSPGRRYDSLGFRLARAAR